VEQAVKDTGISRDKIIAVPNTITPEIYYAYPIQQALLKRFEGKFVVLYLGDTGLRRGTGLAVEALALLKESIPEIHLVLVGKSKEDFILKNLAKKLGVTSGVSFEGWQDVSLFPSYTLAAQVCISPLVRNLHHDTTYANKIFQYMAMERPVVVSDCPPQVRVIEEEKCGLVHEAQDAQDLADKILYLYQNPGLRKEMGANGKRAVLEQYNWHQTSKDLLALYSDLSE
ncbi:MAG: glycosyltransferase, partial [Chitinophagaceae bacterium]